MPLSIQDHINQIVAGQPRKPSPIKNGFQAIQDLLNSGLVDADINASAAITRSKLQTLQSCFAYQAGATTISNDTTTALPLNTEAYDTNNLHDNATNNTRVTIQKAGRSTVNALARWAANITGVRLAYIRLNGSTLIASSEMVATTGGFETSHNLSITRNFIVGDYVELVIKQNSGGNLNIGGGVDNNFLSVIEAA